MKDGNIFYRYTLYNSLFYSNTDTLYKIFHHVQNTILLVYEKLIIS